MDVLKAVQKRYSCRAYQARPVEKEKLEAILNAARLAPSARNIQDWRFVVVTDEQKRKALAHASADQAFVGQSPVVIAGCSCTNKRMNLCAQPYASINVSIALEHIALAATSLGLATCWIGSFVPQQVRAILGIPTSIEIVELMTLGYADDEKKSPRRLSLKQIVSYDQWDFNADDRL